MRLQLREAFDLIDQDGSGAIDVDELEEAFKVLNYLTLAAASRGDLFPGWCV